jgi:hypothetical protein
MISFSDFSDRLARGQLKNTAAVDENMKGEISPDQIDTVLSLTNQGLIDISTRMVLVSRQIDLVFQDSKYMYALDQSGVADYLDDSITEEFVPDDFIRVLSIYDEDGVNHPHDTQGHIMTPSYNVLRFSAAKAKELGPQVRIRYQAKHSGIDFNADINIPPNLEAALQLFVSSLFISHLGGEQHSAKGDSYFAAYLRHMGEDLAQNISSTSEIDSDNRFENRGFV